MIIQKEETFREAFTLLMMGESVVNAAKQVVRNLIHSFTDKGFVSRVKDQKVCLISQDIAYQVNTFHSFIHSFTLLLLRLPAHLTMSLFRPKKVFSTSTAFYIPLCAIIIVYYKIMRAAKKRFRRERDRRTMNRGTVLDESTAKLTGGTTARGGGKCAAKLMLRSQNVRCLSPHSIHPLLHALSSKSLFVSH